MKIVLLNDKKERKSFWISNQLRDAIKDRLAKKEQCIIFINRRGFSFFVQCKSCSFIFSCQSCSVSLTLHSDNLLNCHYCNHSQAMPTTCPSCKTNEFIKKGIGTQQAVTILETMFPLAKIARADLDITQRKKLWQQTMTDFHAGNIDILVGTQSITKGYHFPKVTLVGILWADLNLHFPIYNASETSLQQLIQVAGRAGRQSDESLVIVQTMDDHKIFNYLNEVDYLKFYHDEVEMRSMVGYPPAHRFVEIELKHTNELVIDRESHHIATMLHQEKDLFQYPVRVLGPAKPPVHKIKNMFSRKIYIKGDDIAHIIKLYHVINHDDFQSFIYFTPNPVT
jgi:primosomal protein N''